jgi:hypothetical protein
MTSHRWNDLKHSQSVTILAWFCSTELNGKITDW